MHTDKSCYMEPVGQDLQLARVLRIYYIQDPKSETCPYDKLKLTTRLFVPTRKGGYGKDYESFSKTMQRIITWLNVSRKYSYVNYTPRKRSLGGYTVFSLSVILSLCHSVFLSFCHSVIILTSLLCNFKSV